MHLLLTNDDGINAPGLLALKGALDPLAQVTVIAPSRNYSAAGHRKTMHKPLRIDETRLPDGSPAWVCSGAPSDCVAVALLGFIKDPIEVVVSGINPTPNIGQDVTYSGTVTAALEAVIAGTPGVAVSTLIGPDLNYEPAARSAARLIRAAVERGIPTGVILNMNFPTSADYKGVRITRQGWSVYRDELVERRDPRGRPYYWIGGEAPSGVMDEGTDFWALQNGYVSITPLKPDLTAREALSVLESWRMEV